MTEKILTVHLLCVIKFEVDYIKQKYNLKKSYAIFMLHPDGISKTLNKKYCENNDDRVLIGGQAVVFSKGFFTI